MVTLAEAICSYSSLRMGGYAESTWKAHRGVLSRFARWSSERLGSAIPLTAVGPEAMAAYLDPMRPPVLSAASFNNYRQYLVQFFDHCRAEGWITADPMRYVRPARVRRKLRLQLTAAECRQMIDSAEPRDRIALALGINTALRARDITTLRVGDVDFEAGLIRAEIAKTATEDRLPITADLEDELRRWFEHYAEAMQSINGVRLEWRLVPVRHFQAFDVWHPECGGRVVYLPDRRYKHPHEIVQRGLASIGYPTRGEGFHTLRRTSGRLVHRMALREGDEDPIRVVQALYGHRNQATTERYLGLAPERAARDRLMRGRRLLDG